jgi:menaquinone-dependent protoporphyrinogen IX oxidase
LWGLDEMSCEGSNKVVVYRSRYGSAKRYAEWIAEEIEADIFDGAKVKADDLLKYDTIIFGGAMYAVGMLGIDLISKNYHQLRDKKVIVFSVGASPAHPEAIQAVKDNNFTPEMKGKVPFFHVRGAFDYKRLNFLDKLLMFLLKKKIQLKRADLRDKDEIGMLASYNRPVDWSSKKSIIPILDCIRENQI